MVACKRHGAVASVRPYGKGSRSAKKRVGCVLPLLPSILIPLSSPLSRLAPPTGCPLRVLVRTRLLCRFVCVCVLHPVSLWQVPFGLAVEVVVEAGVGQVLGNFCVGYH